MCQNIEALSNADLLALLVGIKAARRILKDAGGSFSAMLNEPAAYYYLDPKLNMKIQAAKELIRRSLMEPLRRRDMLTSPELVRNYLRLTLEGREHEVFLAIFMGAQNRVIASEELFRGTLSQTSVFPREVVKRSLFHNAAAICLCHFVPRHKMSVL